MNKDILRNDIWHGNGVCTSAWRALCECPAGVAANIGPVICNTIFHWVNETRLNEAHPMRR